MTAKAILIAGPTASGKSALALSVAERFSGEIINTDAMQLYRDIPIISAQPCAEDYACVPHHLYGFVDAEDRYSVGRWLEAAKQAGAQVQQRGRLPIFVGGTGLYFKALLEGLVDVPDIPAPVKEDIAREVNRFGLEQAHAKLAQLDSAWASQVEKGDRQRIVRGLEVVAHTGRPLSAWMDQPQQGLGNEGVAKFVLMPERESAYERSNQRFDEMLREGAIAEVRKLVSRRLAPDLPAMKALGVPQLSSWLQGAVSYEEAISQAKMMTRRYIKRQFTWIRGHMISWNMVCTQDLETLSQEIFSIIEKKA